MGWEEAFVDLFLKLVKFLSRANELKSVVVPERCTPITMINSLPMDPAFSR